MEKTATDITNELNDALSTLLDEIVTEAVENVSDDAAEEYADDNGYTVEEEGEDEWGADDAPPSPAELRDAIVEAYKAGRDAAFDAVKESVNGAR